MSRFDRRLKSSGGSSPRPGTATCKIRKKSTNMLSGFIQVHERNNNETNGNKNNSNSISLIQEVSSSSLVKDVDIIDKTIKTNEQLKKAITATRDANMKRLLYHELRLNILEVNLDCLTDMKCHEITKDQKNNEETYNLESINKKVMTYDESIQKITQDNKEINKSLKTTDEEIKVIHESISNRFRETNNSISEKINILEEEISKFRNKEGNENSNDRLDFLEQENNMLKDKLSVYEEKFKLLLEKLSENNPEYEEMMMH